MLKLPEKLTKATILKYVDEQTIFEYYLGYQIKLGEMYYSPFREEKNPSFNIYINSYNGRLWYKDFAHSSGDCFRLIEELYGCTFIEAMSIVDKDFNLNIRGVVQNIPKIKRPKLKAKEKKVRIEIRAQDFTKYDIEYWKKYYITTNYLKYFRVFSCAQLWIDSFPLVDWRYNKNNLIYAYLYNPTFKVYRPQQKDKREKWRNNLASNHFLGLKQLPKDENIRPIISSSYKDVIVLRRLGLYAIDPGGEGFSLSSLLSYLRTKFIHKPLIWYNNDEQGIMYAQQAAEEYDLEYVHNPLGEPKDPSDFIAEYGPKETKDLLYELNVLK